MQKKAKYSFTGTTAVLIVCTLLVAACSSGGKSATGGTSPEPAAGSKQPAPSTSAPAANGKMPVVTALLNTATNFPTENPVIKAIRQKSGVDFQVESVASADYEKRLNTLLVSGQAPDIFSVSKTKIQELVANGVIMPLDDLIAKYGPNIKENKGPDLRGTAFVGGKVYGIPSISVLGNALAIRKDWLDKLKLPVPTTLDEFEKVLQGFVNDDPDGNGKKDTIGLGAAMDTDSNFTGIFGAFNVPLGQAMLVDGKVTPWMLSPGYVDAVKYLNKLFHAGLIEPEVATIPYLQSVTKFFNGKVGAYNFNAEGTTQNWLTRYVENPKPQFVYVVLKGPQGFGGYPKVVAADAGSYAVVSSKAKDPAAVMKMLDFLVSKEGDAMTWAGIEGTSYQYVNGAFQWIPPYDDAVKLRDFGGYMYSVLLNRTNGMKESLLNDATKQGIKLVTDNPIKSAYIFGVPQVQVEKGKILSDMEKEFRTKAMLADSGAIDQMYADFKKKYLDGGGNEWITQATKIYNDEQAARK
ncbi:extracellular solute-binding protein [Paenibacillus cymbidii]|uniref:extracellular solute-binding protein n=1 Tax=Paenibacillus cymbidii TaxID=1639034 RepID=UPI00143692F7|nr:extracellular solute-binding protein [Paenibacillus cymbidii]